MAEQTTDAERGLALQRALAISAPDAVFELVRHNRSRQLVGSSIELSELSSIADAATLEQWHARSVALYQGGYNAGNALLRDDGSYAEARKQLEIDHPGFGEESYAGAVDRGAFEAR